MDLLLAQAAQAAQSDPTALGVAIAAFAAAMASGAKQIADAIKNKGAESKDTEEHATLGKRLDKIESDVALVALSLARVEVHLLHVQKQRDQSK